MKETNNTINQKIDLAYTFWIQDYPKKKEKDVVEVKYEDSIKFKRGNVVDKISIEEQKVLLLAPTII